MIQSSLFSEQNEKLNETCLKEKPSCSTDLKTFYSLGLNEKPSCSTDLKTFYSLGLNEKPSCSTDLLGLKEKEEYLF